MKWKAVILSLISFGLAWKTQAQYLSGNGNFQVDQIKGCADFTIRVTPVGFICDDDIHPCAAFYENDTASIPLITPPFTHTYTQPGIYTLKVLYGPLSDTITIEVLPNIPPEFDVYTCGGNMVSVKITDTNYDEYIVDYNDGSPPVVLNIGGTHSHQYAASSPQTVTVRGRNLNAADNCNEAGKIVTPLASLPAPTITLLEVLDDESIRLEFDALPNLQYKLGIATNNNTTFQQLKTIYNQTVDTIFNLRTDDNYYCFQLAAFDPCNNTVLNSATICSANTDLTVHNNAIDLKWATATAGTSGFTLSRIASDGTILTTNTTGSVYADTEVACGAEYCYRLTTRYPNGSRSLSLLKCGTGFSTDIPTPIQNISSVADDNSVALEWLTDPDFTPVAFEIEKATQGGGYAFLTTATVNSYTDNTYIGETGACYRIRYQDACDNQSPPGIEVCPLVLTATLLKDNAISLAWNSYQGWAMGVSGYVVEKYSKDGTLLQSFPVGTATTYVDDSDDLAQQVFVYLVKATAVESGVNQSVSNRVAVLKDPNLFHPTAFTPNGDNLNDTFTVLGQYVVGFEMKIFNRWGEMLFSTEDITSGWDGTFRGREMPEGTYTFIAYITDRAGRTFKRSGSVLLLRK